MISRPTTDLIFLAPIFPKETTAMSRIPSIPEQSLDDMPDEKTFDALVLDHRVGVALNSIAAYERAHRRVLADLADVDRDLATDFIDETSTLRTFLPYLVGTLRSIQHKQRPLLDRTWAQMQQAIHARLLDDAGTDGEPERRAGS